MNFLAGVVPVLFLLHWKLVAGFVLPLNSQSPICKDLHTCGDNTQSQVQSQLKMLNVKATDLFDTYASYQGFYDQRNAICDPQSIDFPTFNASETCHKKRMVELYKIFVYLHASLGNISKEQHDLNENAFDLHAKLLNTTATIQAVISNLTCLLCKHYRVNEVDLFYGKTTNSEFEKKKRGCQVLNKYTQFISQAAQDFLKHWQVAHA